MKIISTSPSVSSLRLWTTSSASPSAACICSGLKDNYLYLVFCLFWEETAQNVEISSVFFQHKLECLSFLSCPYLGFLLHIRIHCVCARVAGNGLCFTKCLLLLRFLTNKADTLNSMVSIRKLKVCFFCWEPSSSMVDSNHNILIKGQIYSHIKRQNKSITIWDNSNQFDDYNVGNSNKVKK